MEKIVMRYQTTAQAVETLEQALVLYMKAHNNEDTMLSSAFEFKDVFRALRDSIVQRFEYSTDLLWKYLKDYLELELKIIPEVRSPKNIIRSCSTIGLLTEKEAGCAISMIDARNMTSHVYREEIAEELIKQIPVYLDLMKVMLQKTNPSKE